MRLKNEKDSQNRGHLVETAAILALRRLLQRHRLRARLHLRLETSDEEGN